MTFPLNSRLKDNEISGVTRAAFVSLPAITEL